MTTTNPPTPAALVTGEPIRMPLTDEERGALLQAAARFRGRALIEIADALGLCGPPPVSHAYMPGSAGNPTFGSTPSGR